MSPFTRATMDDNPSSSSISGRTCILSKDDGTLSVILAFIFLIAVFFAQRMIYNGTNKAETKDKIIKQGKYLMKRKNRGGLLEIIEVNFVDPFVPASLEHYVLVIFFLWFLFTIPMAITRYYKNIWALEMLGQHAIFNYISFLFFGW